ncbi:TetR/AcrR family transcriptional regulator [Zavarzinia sp.]|uniref:TetR/AcrR family transcriptional regulator n=1 Tax=Zavarzinia sp. TaxID=2027920 RepID=UPI00356582E6
MARQIAERAEIVPLLGEVFREHGYEGASLSVIGKATGLGKGSLYHFFPGGKEEMAAAVLAEVDAWFEAHIYAPLRDETDAAAALARTTEAVIAYFRSGRRVCLVGAFALDQTRDRFAAAIRRYFARWVEALAEALTRLGRDPAAARAAAEGAVASLQGALVLARATGEPALFERVVRRDLAALLAP